MHNAIWQARFAPTAERAPELRRLSRRHARAALHRAIQSEPLCDDRCLTLIQRLEKSADLIGEVFLAEQFERRLRLFIWNVFAKFGHVIVANKRIERFATQANAFHSRQFFGGNAKLLAQLVLGRLVAEIVARLG